MDTNRLKRFATEARNILNQGVAQRFITLGFNPDGTCQEEPVERGGGATFMGDVVSMDFYRKWMSLKHAIETKSVTEVVEEAAYTWFNRLVAIRIMAKQDFITPVLQYESEDVHVPIIVSEARQGRMPKMTEAVRTKLMDLLDDDSKTSEQFALLIVAYCHENPIINRCFGAIADYTELLLPQNILKEGGFVDMINHTEFITEEQYASAELIGWLYQFYISDRKDEAFAKKGKYDADEIAPATQIFTPNWIVKYMTENTLGRIYVDNNPYCDLKDDLKYLVNEQPSAPRLEVDDVAELKAADLACGSGHILNECFDMLYKIYVEEGYSRRQAIKDILRKNLLGIDLDTRAKQLASFALLMKACQKDSSFLDGKVMPRVYNMPRPISEAIPSDRNALDAEAFLEGSIHHYMMGSNSQMTKELKDAILLMNHADTLGSIMKFDISESTRNALMVRTEEYEEQIANGEFVPETNQLFIPYMNIILALTDKYAAICMNPPYMGSGRFDNVLSKYVKDNYPRSKADLMSVFMDVAIDRLAPNGKYGMINMHSWMFLSSFEELRRDLLDYYTIDSLLHLGPRTFDELSGEVVQNASFVITNANAENKFGTYFRLVDGRNCADKEDIYLNALNRNTEKIKYSSISQKNFKRIANNPIAYWVSNRMVSTFRNNLLGQFGWGSKGIITGDNNRFLRFWFEVSNELTEYNADSYQDTIGSDKKWYPVTKGGSFRRWYGNNEYIIDWEGNGHRVIQCAQKENRNCQDYQDKYKFKPSFSWADVCSNSPSFRYTCNSLSESKGMCLFSIGGDIYEMGGFLNSCVAKNILLILSPTLMVTAGAISKLPFIPGGKTIKNRVKDNISISRLDWDAHETSWDFKTNELVRISQDLTYEQGASVLKNDAGYKLKLEKVVSKYETEWAEKFMQLHANEEELNRQFIEIYGLQEELTPDVPLDEITILQQGEISIENNNLKWHEDVVMKQLISYAVGCMMGRYSIDKAGLILANQGDGLDEYNEQVPNSRFEVDDDGIIPLMASDTDFADNATLRFKNWLTVTFGEDSLVENLNYIEKCLGKTIDDYFVKDFWTNHKKMYSNRPIYWMFRSKKGAFQCIAYMHRMSPYTAEAIRTKYLLPHIEWLVNQKNEMQANAANLSTRERKQLDSIIKQIDECREYHDRLHVIADQQIVFDLDDGIVVNYAKFGDVLQKLK